MTIVDTTAVMTKPEAERITTRIELRLTTAAENFTTGMQLIREAISGGAHGVLGFASPGAYIADKFGDALAGLGIHVRREVVRELSEAGLSSRAIASVVRVDQKTVINDIHAGEESSSPDPIAAELRSMGIDATEADNIVTISAATDAEFEDALGQAKASGDLSQANVVSVLEMPRTTTGLDGKKYKVPEKKKPQRRPLPPQFQSAVHHLSMAAMRLEALASDDRFASHREAFEADYGKALNNTESRLFDLIEYTLQGKSIPDA